MNEELKQYGMSDVKIVPDNIQVTVTDISIRLAKNVYGDHCNKPEQELIVLRCENDMYDVKNEQTIPKYPKEKVNNQMILGKFLMKYGQFETGMSIQLNKDKNGFWQINL